MLKYSRDFYLKNTKISLENLLVATGIFVIAFQWLLAFLFSEELRTRVSDRLLCSITWKAWQVTHAGQGKI